MLRFYRTVGFEAESTTAVSFATVILTEVVKYEAGTPSQRVAETLICSGNTDRNPKNSGVYLTTLFSMSMT